MKIGKILKKFEKETRNTLNEANKNKPITFQVDWRYEQFDVQKIDMTESYWYFEDDGTIVFRINDNIGVDDDYKLKTGTFQEFKKDLERFLKENGDKEQGECDSEIENTFFFYTADEDGLSGSYWRVSEFAIIKDDDKVIIKINDFS